MAEKQLVLTPAEARVVCDILADDVDGMGRGLNQEERQRRFRLLVKIDKALPTGMGYAGPFSEIPDWIREILHRTFAPPQVAAKKAAPKGAKSSSPKTAGPSPKPSRALPKGAGLGLKAGEED